MTAQTAKVATEEDLQVATQVTTEEEALDLRTRSILTELKKKLRKDSVDYETEKTKILALIARYRELKTRIKQVYEGSHTINGSLCLNQKSHRHILSFWEYIQLEELAYLFRNVEKGVAWISGLYLGREGTHDKRTVDLDRDPFKSFNPTKGTWDKHNRFWNKFKYWNELFEVEGWNGVSNPKLFWEEIGKKRLADPVFWKLQAIARQEYEKWKAYRREESKKRYHRHHKKIVTVSWFGNFWFLIENGRPRGRGRLKGSRDSYPRIRNRWAGKSGEIRYDHDHDDHGIEIMEIEEQCANCKKFAELKNGYNYYTGTRLKLCEECLESDSRFRRGNPTLYCKYGCDFTTTNKEVLERHEKTEHELSDRARRYREGEDAEDLDD